MAALTTGIDEMVYVAIRRNWIPVPNLQLAKGGGGEAGRAHHCNREKPLS